MFLVASVPDNKQPNRDILKWAFAEQILRPFQTTVHASVLRYAP